MISAKNLLYQGIVRQRLPFVIPFCAECELALKIVKIAPFREVNDQNANAAKLRRAQIKEF